MILFPSAFLEDNVSFEAVDAKSAHVILTHAGRTASGTLFFDPEGRLTEFVARRYDGTNLETWSVSIAAYGQFEGLNLPVRGKAAWKLAEGDQEYIDVTITELHYEGGPSAAPCSTTANGCPTPHDPELTRNDNPERFPLCSRPSTHRRPAAGAAASLDRARPPASRFHAELPGIPYTSFTVPDVQAEDERLTAQRGVHPRAADHGPRYRAVF